MLAKLQMVLRAAQRGRYAVGAFNVSNLEQAQAVVVTAEQLRAPVIVNTTERAIEYAGLEPLALIVKVLARRSRVPVVLNLDHGHRLETAKACLQQGYTGLMFDASRQSYRRNVQLTRQIALAARRHQVGVEGELGRVKYPSELKKNPALELTDADQAREFVKSTRICALAIAIGNSHGIPISNERLDFMRLSEIRRQVTVPLVLHGASGTPANQIFKAIQLGICKINIDTDLRKSFSAEVRRQLRHRPQLYDPRDYLGPARTEMEKIVRSKIIQFKSRGKAR